VKLSIVIPCYNEKDTILQIIEKVKASPLDKEIIIVDDCSTDGTREILETQIAHQVDRNFANLYVKMILSEFSETDRREYARLKVADFLRPDRNEGYRQGGIGTWYDAMIPATWPIPLEEIKTKVYLWQGEEDISVPLAMGRYIAKKIPDCEATYIKGFGHFWIFEHMGEMLTKLVPHTFIKV